LARLRRVERPSSAASRAGCADPTGGTRLARLDRCSAWFGPPQLSDDRHPAPAGSQRHRPRRSVVRAAAVRIPLSSTGPTTGWGDRPPVAPLGRAGAIATPRCRMRGTAPPRAANRLRGGGPNIKLTCPAATPVSDNHRQASRTKQFTRPGRVQRRDTVEGSGFPAPRSLQFSMRFLTATAASYVGVDLHARTLFLCVLD